MKCKCSREVILERAALEYKTCLSCGEAIAKEQKPYGYVSYGHKTAGAIVVTSKKGFENYSKVSSRMNKGSNMSYASKVRTQF